MIAFVKNFYIVCQLAQQEAIAEAAYNEVKNKYADDIQRCKEKIQHAFKNRKTFHPAMIEIEKIKKKMRLSPQRLNSTMTLSFVKELENN